MRARHAGPVRAVVALVLLAGLVVVPADAGASGAPTGKLVAQLAPPDTTYTADVVDPDGGPLTYVWSGRIECGTFTPNTPAANQAVWSHPSGEPPGGCPHEEGMDHTGTVTVVVRDQQGNELRCSLEGSGSGEQNCTLYGEDLDDCTINLRLFDAQRGSTPSDRAEESRGAFTVLNANDTDGDRERDRSQGRVAGERDLMRLRLLAPQPDAGGSVTLEIPSGAGRIAFYRTAQKGVRLRPDPVLTFPTHRLPITLWVEGRRVSRRVRDVALEYAYRPPLSDSACTDTANATIVWAELLDARHDAGDRIWPDLQGPPRGALERHCGGFGLRPRGPTPRGVRNCIGFQFEVRPPGVGGEPGVEFDITRQKNSLAVQTINGQTTEQASRWPDGETANDDRGDNDESPSPNGNGRMYGFDGPGTPNPEAPPGSRVSYNANFREFMRVRFDGQRPTGNVESGSAVSARVPWAAAHRWRTEDGRLVRTTGNRRETATNFVRLR